MLDVAGWCPSTAKTVMAGVCTEEGSSILQKTRM
jgi:hypothetical protein